MNRLQPVVSIPHLCMKYLVGVIHAYLRIARMCYKESLKVGRRIPIQDSIENLDPRQNQEDQRPQPMEDLKEVQISLRSGERTKIGPTLHIEVERQLVHFFGENWDVFGWSPEDIPRIDPDFLCHRLSITIGAWSVA
ncbi:hypothetical protein CR513_15536, partial [Mucuna pruriens]